MLDRVLPPPVPPEKILDRIRKVDAGTKRSGYIVEERFRRRILGYRVLNKHGKDGPMCATKKDAWDKFNDITI